MQLIVYRWATCAHTEHVDLWGQRADYYQISDPENIIVKHEGTPPYHCPACSDPTGNHNTIGTVPVAGAAVIPYVYAEVLLVYKLFTDPVFRPLVAGSKSDSESDATVSDGGSHDGVTLNPRVQPFAPGVQSLATSANQLDKLYDEPLGHVAAIDTSELANYDAHALNPLQEARLAGLFGSLTTNDHSNNNNVSQQQTGHSIDDSVSHQQSDNFVNDFSSQQHTGISTNDPVTQQQTDFLVNDYLGVTQQVFQHTDPTGLAVYAPIGFPGDPSTDNFVNIPHGFAPHPSTDIITYAPTTGAVGLFQQPAIKPVRYGRGTGPDFVSGFASKGPRRPAKQPNMNAPTAPRDLRALPHKSNKPCPESHAACHWHYADWCHKDPGTCPAALKAIKAAYEAKGAWKGAPDGWNDAHQNCILADNPQRCLFHQWVERQRHSHQIV
ncbi:hypothetical protein E4T38_07392 [Aureobasidium subglaciale]|nr:hypothetical protein E4T38_07392 [Aureobasidium subglaciale]KAI5217482.1 hypothetical protein E4T40_07403 [Aureobasidium subglaciale]KAI5221011.1 hypothetical protein E4T41_07244 [Aureobasidium subglaciale]KAI5258570.1 hypothetical protein E4T46_07221 [Aureobasidium subglaciale]